MTEETARTLLIQIFNTYSNIITANYKDGVIQEAFEMAIEALADRKTEPTSSKMEQVDEPITQTKTQNSNLTFEKADEPQTDEEYINNLPWTEVGNGEQTDCPWK